MDSFKESTTAEDNWDNDNDKALRHMLLKIETHLANKWQLKDTAKEIWDGLEAQFSKTSISFIYMEFKVMMDTIIPKNNHPSPSFAKLTHHFTHLKEYKYDIPSNVQAMIVLAKLPQYMDIIAQLLNMSQADETNSLSLQMIENAAIMAWQQHVTKWKLQQQQQAGGSSEKLGEKKKGKSHQGNRSQAGKQKQQEQHKRQYANEIPTASFAFHSTPVISPAMPPSYQTTVNLHVLSHRPASTPYREPAFPHTKNTISLTHHLGIIPTIETVHALDPMANCHLDWSGGIPTNKCPHLEECLDKDLSKVTGPSHHHTNTFGGKPLPSSSSPKEKTYIHTWDEDDKGVIDINRSENGFDVDDYYINADIFNKDQFLGMAEEFGFDMDIWSVPSCLHLSDTDAQSFSPQNNIIFTCLSVVGSDMDTKRPTFLHSHCDDCTKSTCM